MSFSNFCQGLNKHVRKTFGTLLQTSCARNQAVIATHLNRRRRGIRKNITEYNNSELRIYIPRIFKKEYIIKYAVLSWYMESNTRFYLQEILRAKCEQLGYPEIKFLYLYSRELMMFTLFSENDLKLGNLFGNILQPGVNVNINYIDSYGNPRNEKQLRADYFDIQEYIQPKAKKSAFKSGYDDHGSMASLDVKARREANKSLFSLEKELEKQNAELRAKNKQLEFLIGLEGIDS